ncbi:MAG: EamA family transporter [Sphingobacteriales bacterium]|nr:MAG: EamA family transporter [Sphingobacteriales bacterium]TAF82825.1 MAG: EamA family transporter [Sphingobacteriales bacterium]
MASLQKSIITLHITVMVWGFTGILGALISVNEYQLVWYRVGIAAVSLAIFCKIKNISLKADFMPTLKLLGTGLLLGLHWILFFGAIKASNISITMVCLSSLTLFTSILEPIFNRVKVSKLEVLIGMVIIFGIYLIFQFESQYTKGILMGLSSALIASLFTIINGKQIKKRSAIVISFYELLGAFGGVSLYLLCSKGLQQNFYLPASDIIYLLILGTLCTSVAYVYGVQVMQHLSAFRVVLITNLEPVYAVLMALLFFGKTEQMSHQFYIGALIILTSIFTYPALKAKQKLSN